MMDKKWGKIDGFNKGLCESVAKCFNRFLKSDS